VADDCGGRQSNRLQSVIRPHVEDMPKLPRAALFNRVGEYIQTAMQANRNLAAENEVRTGAKAKVATNC
jgi:hypothetical protein